MNERRRFCGVPHTVHMGNDGKAAIHDLLGGRVVWVEREVVALLQECTGFLCVSTLREKMRLQGWDNATEQLFERTLAKARRLGLLIGESDGRAILARLKPGVEDGYRPDEAGAMARVAILTHGNPENALAMADRIGPSAFVAFDGRIDDNHLIQNRARIADEHDITAFIERAVRGLSLAPEDEEAFRFGLLGTGFEGIRYGAMRNAMILLAGAGPLVMLDDDIDPFNARIWPKVRRGIEISSRSCPPAMVPLLPDPGDSRWGTPYKGDWLGEMSAILDQSVDSLAAAQSLRLDSCTREMFYKLAKTPSRVMVALPGIYGDCGRERPYAFLLTTEPDRSRVMAEESVYDSYKRSRLEARVVDRLTISRGPWVMSTALGLSGSGSLPPFPPVFRNEDGAWGQAVKAARPDALFAHLPFALHHTPKGRTFSGEDYSRFSLRVLDIIAVVLRSYTPRRLGMDPKDRFEDLGRFIMEIGELPAPKLTRHLAPLVIASIALEISRFDSIRYRFPGDPPYVRKDALALQGAMKACLADRAWLEPVELYRTGTGETGIEGIGRYLRSYGRLVRLWPSLLDYAARTTNRNQ